MKLSMIRDLAAFDETFDVAVVGAGVHGVCIARLAAMAGLRTALIDKGDFSGSTSRNSAKLLHGGLRYIQHLDVPRIRESMRSQRAWFCFAPHLVRPLRFVIPTYGYGTRGPVFLAGGLAAFHLIAADRNRGISPGIRLPRSGLLIRSSLLALHPALERPDVTGGAYWADGQMLDAARLALECVADAAERGAVVANHVEAVQLIESQGVVRGIEARDALTGREFPIRAHVTVNAAGPWFERILALGPKAGRMTPPVAWTRSVNLVTRLSYPGQDAIGIASNQASDAALGKSKRLFFVSPWHGCTIVGTTHDHTSEDPDAIRAPDDVVSGFVEEFNAAAPAFSLQKEDILSIHLGLTPAEDAQSTRAHRSLVIDHAERSGISGLLSVAGIKYTTAPEIASQVVRHCLKQLRRPPKTPSFDLPARGVPVPLASTAQVAEDAQDGEPRTEHLWASRVYGSRAEACLGQGRSLPEAQVFRRRVRYGVEHEMVVRLSDAIFRATDWAERGRLTEDHLDWCVRTMSEALHWSAEQASAELQATRSMLDRLHIRLLPTPPGESGGARIKDVHMTLITGEAT